MFLETSSERVVRNAAQEYVAGALRPEIEGELTVATRNGRYRFIDGVCFGASDAEIVGAELVGWLLESERTTAVSAWWRRGARAVLLVRRPRAEIVVSSPTKALEVEGKAARDGFATHRARFIAERSAEPRQDDEIELLADEDVELEVEADMDADDDLDACPLRPSTPAEDPWASREPMASGPELRLPTGPLPVSPHVARVLGPVALPPVALPPRRVAG